MIFLISVFVCIPSKFIFTLFYFLTSHHNKLLLKDKFGILQLKPCFQIVSDEIEWLRLLTKGLVAQVTQNFKDVMGGMCNNTKCITLCCVWGHVACDDPCPLLKATWN